ncbi:MAG TPA: class I SAM-dependent methyltransferase [Bacteroidia bacterium]|nr:class I SAM-dependent methyltransferase [Bacteroidia bacterium]HNU32883.1 class I SAM-dependent methyltransferase [Bacteroidia bacterium]
MENNQWLTANKELWNKRTGIHINSEFYNLNDFRKGNQVLCSTELTELGSVKDKVLLHLQCHFGMDTLSWAMQGAKVTGVDFSDEAIAKAKGLAAEMKMDAQFVCCNVYDVLEHKLPKHDIVFTSYGTIGWLPDLRKWAEIIAGSLKPGGIFYMIDFHPIVWMLDNKFTFIQYSYFNKEVIKETESGTYADENADINLESYGWNHSTSDLLNALISNGLRLEFFNEHDFSHYNCFANTVQIANDKWQIKGLEGKIPMMYSLQAVKG